MLMLLLHLGCGDDGGGAVTTTDTDGGSGSDSSATTGTTTDSTTTATTGSPEVDAVGPCKPAVSGVGAFTPAQFDLQVVDLAKVCNDDLLGVSDVAHVNPVGGEVLRVQDPDPNEPENNDNFDVLVYAHDTKNPLEDPLPLVVFVPGNNQFSYLAQQNEELYAHLAAPIVEDGYN